MSIKTILSKGFHGLAACLLVAVPATGWSSVISDRPLFIEAGVDHNLMFAVDNSGSMDFEVLAPEVGDAAAVDRGYLFDTGYERPYEKGRRLYDGRDDVLSFSRRNHYLRSPDYNLQYYDPKTEYIPWPSTSSRSFSDATISDAYLDPGLSASLKVDLTESDILGLGSGNYPATVFVKNEGMKIYTREETTIYGSCPSGQEVNPDDQAECGVIESVRKCLLFACWYEDEFSYRGERPYSIDVVDTEVLDCSSSATTNYYDNWRSDPNQFIYKRDDGTEVTARKVALAPNGACLQRLELVDDGGGVNASEVLAATGETLAEQQQNFANWFQYYRRRHQAIRAAIGRSVEEVENMRLGAMGINDGTRFDMSSRMYSTSTGLEDFLDDQYALFDSGNYSSNGTPNRAALQHAGQEYSKTTVRGTLECRKNFTLLFTDGFSNEFDEVTIVAGNADKDADAPFDNEDYSNTLGDIAYYYYQGLRSGSSIIDGGNLPVHTKCDTPSEEDWMDCNSNYHMNSYTVTLGMEGQNFAGKKFSKVRDAHDADPDPDWGASSMNSANEAQIDDVFHAAVNGKGEYYDASSTAELITALASAIGDIESSTGSGSNLNFNTSSLKEEGLVFSAEFTSVAWTGDLTAETINADGEITGTAWSAAALLDDPDFSPELRTVLTYGSTGGVSFEWSNLTTDQQDDLKVGGGSDAETLGQKRLDYLRGEAIEKVGDVEFRERGSLLGPIINSSPQYVGIPGKNWPNIDPFGADGSRYAKFRSNKEDRQKMVYVGGNDGMLHGFNASTGEEELAYIPSFLFSDEPGEGLHALTQTSYDYQSYVDLPVAASDIYTDGEWRTVVISGARGNGPGLFALDVTNPSSFSADTADDIVMWEFTPEDDANLGHMTSAVQVTLLDWGSTGDDYRWSAVFENGYGTERNGIFVLDLSKSPSAEWQDGVNYEFIDLTAGDGLSPVRLVDYVQTSGSAGSDGIADRLYAGDRNGRMWAVSLQGGSGSWGSAYGTNPLVTVTDSSGVVQPITSRPIVAYNRYDDSAGAPNLIVMFGSGEYLNYEDLGDEQEQSFYGVNDRGEGDLSRAEGDLTEREMTEVVHPDDSVTSVVRQTDADPLDWEATYGWYLDFKERTGERVVAAPSVEGDYVVFPTLIPVSDDPCGGGGASFIMALALDGSTDPAKSILDVNNDKSLNETDAGWSGVYIGDTIITSTTRLGDLLFGAGSDTSKKTILTDLGNNDGSARRASWREVVPE